MFNAHADDFSEFLVDPDEDMLGSMEIPSFIQPVNITKKRESISQSGSFNSPSHLNSQASSFHSQANLESRIPASAALNQEYQYGSDNLPHLHAFNSTHTQDYQQNMIIRQQLLAQMQFAQAQMQPSQVDKTDGPKIIVSHVDNAHIYQYNQANAQPNSPLVMNQYQFPQVYLPTQPLSYSHPSQIPKIAASYPASYASTFDDTLSLSLNPDDKRKKRRESHNLVERRRRDTINDNIMLIANLLPDLVLSIDQGVKPQKGVVLGRTVDYITHVQGLMIKANERIVELEGVVRGLMKESGRREDELGLTVPLGSVLVNTDILVPHPARRHVVVSNTVKEEEQQEIDDSS